MINSTDESFSRDIVNEHPVFVKFGADWCGPCKSIQPLLNELESENPNVVFRSVNIDETSIAQKYNIRGVPTILIFKNGEVVNTIVGAQPKSRLQLAIDTALA